MARPIVLGNGELHVGINRFGQVHDFYYPYVGYENHAAGSSIRHHIGVWVDGGIHWTDNGDWEFNFSYPYESLIGHIIAKNKKIDIVIEFDDMVDSEFNAFVRNIHVVNLRPEKRDIRLFIHQAFIIGDSRSNTDTAQYLPDANAILHYRGRRAFVISARTEVQEYFDQYSIGLFGIEGRKGTFCDAEDGELACNNVEQGCVDSIVRFKLDIDGHSSRRVHYWIACGTSTREALYVCKAIDKQGIYRRYDTTRKWWQNWLKPIYSTVEKIDERYRRQFINSAMIVKSHIDKRGAVIASTDSSMLSHWRDAYGYCWPRDGAFVLWPLIRMGYVEEPRNFFDFCRRVMTTRGYLMHKYRADGALGSSWHAYVHDDGSIAPPIQADETALVLFVFSQFYKTTKDDSILKEFYDSMVVPMANFLANYVDIRTGLPKASYDLWEEQYATFTYTTAVTYASLAAAAELAEIRQDSLSAVSWRSTAESIKRSAREKLYSKNRESIVKSISVSSDGDITQDTTIDSSSIYGSFMFGLFSVDSDEIKNSINTAKKTFDFSTPNRLGLPRYENDKYQQYEDDEPNWWFNTSLWMAQYCLETGDNHTAYAILDWVCECAWSTGVLSEQIDPQTGDERSLSPLAWSQAEFMSTVLDTISENK